MSVVGPGRLKKYREGGTKPPNARGLYRITSGDKIMYIGLTNDLLRRMNDHIRTGKFKIDEGEAFEYAVAKSDTDWDDLCETERVWIARHHPPRNQREGGGGRHPK